MGGTEDILKSTMFQKMRLRSFVKVLTNNSLLITIGFLYLVVFEKDC